MKPRGKILAAIQAALEKGGVAYVDDNEKRGIMAPRSTAIVVSDTK
jgi:hypothetical protein